VLHLANVIIILYYFILCIYVSVFDFCIKRFIYVLGVFPLEPGLTWFYCK